MLSSSNGMRRHQATTAFALPCLCAAILLSAACTTQASYQRQIKHTRELLLQAGDPDSLETAAFLTEFGKDEQLKGWKHLRGQMLRRRIGPKIGRASCRERV